MPHFETLVPSFLGLVMLAVQGMEIYLLVWLAVCVACYAFVSHLPLRSLAPLLAMPAVWLFVAFWATVFRAPHITEHVGWVAYPAYAAGPLFDALMLFLVWQLKEARVLVVAFSVLNGCLVTRLAFVSGMAVSGIWL